MAIGNPPTWVELVAGILRIGRRNLRVYQIDEPVLEPGMPLLFVRYLNPGIPPFRGFFTDRTVRTALRLAVGDTATQPGHWLIIGGVGHLVTARTGRVATLTPAVAGFVRRPVYRTAAALASVGVRDTDLGTLAELGTPRASLTTLDFRPGTSPARQAVRVQAGTWALLRDAWTTAPQETGSAAVPGTVTGRPIWTESALERGYQNPELSWEYYDGRGWARIETRFADGTDNLSSAGDLTFTVPDDLTPTEIGGQTDYWIRARLVGGDYGRPGFVVHTTGTPPDTEQSVTVDTSNMHPPEILGIEATFNLGDELAAAEVLLVENNLDVVDQTQAAAVPEARFDLFSGAVAVAAADRALFVGLTGPLDAGVLSLLVDAVDQEGTGPLRVDLRTADGWRQVGVDDRTESLRRRGLVSVSLDVVPVTVRLFGRDLVWLRLRPTGTGARAPEVRGLYLNAVEITQARTLGNEILGSSLGEPGLSVALAEAPVLPDTVVLRVRERISDEERAALEAEQKAAAEPGQEPPEPVVVSGLEQVLGTGCCGGGWTACSGPAPTTVTTCSTRRPAA